MNYTTSFECFWDKYKLFYMKCRINFLEWRHLHDVQSPPRAFMYLYLLKSTCILLASLQCVHMGYITLKDKWHHNSGNKSAKNSYTESLFCLSYHHLAVRNSWPDNNISTAVLFKNVLILKQLLLLLPFRIAVFIHLCQWIITWAWNRAGENMKEISKDKFPTQ